MPQSRLHHYIPQFYIRGFRSPEGFYYLYDKQTGKISRRTSSKQLFFEWDRNTIEEHGKQYTTLEEEGYSKLDNSYAQTVTKLRDRLITDDLISEEVWGEMMFFTVNLFWRVPKTDAAFQKYFESSKVTFFDENGKPEPNPEMEEDYRLSATMRKAHRTFMAVETIEAWGTSETRKETPMSTKLVEIPHDFFVLGDFPIVYILTPFRLTHLIEREFFIPISSKRVYFTAEKCSLDFDEEKIFNLNAVIIDEAVRYVCGANREALQLSVKHWERLKAANTLLPAKFRLFGYGANQTT